MLLFYEPVLKKLFTKSFRSYSELGLICLMAAAEQEKKKKKKRVNKWRTTQLELHFTIHFVPIDYSNLQTMPVGFN